ncbi:MAG: LysE family translocator [Simkaniaceae bacterium]|nr:LysE family translocator [Simkaniaceae bacterium]
MDVTLLASVGSISLLAAMSPGPDFAMIVKNTLAGSFHSGIKTALGILTALCIHLTYITLGLEFLINDYPMVFKGVQILGALYLLYLGTSMLIKKPSSTVELSEYQSPFLSGFLCNLLNPKVMVFLLALFTEIIGRNSSRIEAALAASVLFLVSLAWFCILAFSLSRPMIKQRLLAHQRKVNVVMGAVLFLFALKMFI